MALASSVFSPLSTSTIVGDGLRKPASSASSPSCSLSFDKKWGSRNVAVSAATAPLTGVIFEPFEEVKKEALAVPVVPQVSLARQNYADECESVINEQIK